MFTMNNSSRNLDGYYGPQKDKSSTTEGFKKHTAAAVGLTTMFGAFVGLGAMIIKWKNDPRTGRGGEASRYVQ